MEARSLHTNFSCILETVINEQNHPLGLSTMDTSAILQTLPTLSTQDRLIIAETALKFIWQEQQSLTPIQRKQQLMLAAATAISDYQAESDLLTFSALDGEDFLQDWDKDIEVTEPNA